MQLLQQSTVLILTEPQRAIAKSFAESEFEKYRIVQDQLFESDFDKLIKKELGGLTDE